MNGRQNALLGLKHSKTHGNQAEVKMPGITFWVIFWPVKREKSCRYQLLTTGLWCLLLLIITFFRCIWPIRILNFWANVGYLKGDNRLYIIIMETHSYIFWVANSKINLKTQMTLLNLTHIIWSGIICRQWTNYANSRDVS